MSEVSNRRFVHFDGTKEEFITGGYPSTYTDSIVFINGDGDESNNTIYTHGEYYGDSPIGTGEGSHSILLKNSNNTTFGSYNIALGENNTCGIKAVYYTFIDFTERIIYLSYNQPTKNHDFSNRITNELPCVGCFKINDTISIVNDSKYFNCAVVTSVGDDYIQVDNIPFDYINVPQSISIDDFSVFNLFNLSLYENKNTTPISSASICFGDNNTSCLYGSFSEGCYNFSYGHFSHTEGQSNIAYYSSHAEGWNNKSIGDCSHTEGFTNISEGKYSHTEGYNNKSIGNASHAEGVSNIVEGKYSHAEGKNNVINGESSHAEGEQTQAVSKWTHSEGYGTIAGNKNVLPITNTSLTAGYFSHAEGNGTIASGNSSHSEGKTTIASGFASHAEGFECEATSNQAHAEGYQTKAANKRSHAEGYQTKAKGEDSHAEGHLTEAIGYSSHAGGCNTITNNKYEFACGYYNNSTGSTLFSVGGGTTTSRANALELSSNRKMSSNNVQSYNDYHFSLFDYNTHLYTNEQSLESISTVNILPDKKYYITTEKNITLSFIKPTTKNYKTNNEYDVFIENKSQSNIIITLNGEFRKYITRSSVLNTNAPLIEIIGLNFNNENTIIFSSIEYTTLS